MDSENKKNLQNDMWRVFQLNKHLTRPGHPWNKFGTGDKNTLTEAARKLKTNTKSNGNYEKPSFNSYIDGSSDKVPSPMLNHMASPVPSDSSASSEGDADGGMVGRETRRRLIEWWSKEYCAGRMSLAIIGKGKPLYPLLPITINIFFIVRITG